MSVLELAAGAIRAIEILVEALAGLGLVILRDVLLLHELVVAVGEGTRVCEGAVASLLPVPAHLGLVLHLESFLITGQLVSILGLSGG